MSLKLNTDGPCLPGIYEVLQDDTFFEDTGIDRGREFLCALIGRRLFYAKVTDATYMLFRPEGNSLHIAYLKVTVPHEVKKVTAILVNFSKLSGFEKITMVPKSESRARLARTFGFRYDAEGKQMFLETDG